MGIIYTLIAYIVYDQWYDQGRPSLKIQGGDTAYLQ